MFGRCHHHLRHKANEPNSVIEEALRRHVFNCHKCNDCGEAISASASMLRDLGSISSSDMSGAGVAAIMFSTNPIIMAAVTHRLVNALVKHCEVDFDKQLRPKIASKNAVCVVIDRHSKFGRAVRVRAAFD